MLHITIESEDDFIKEMLAASKCQKRCREFVSEYGYILYQIPHPKKSFPSEFVDKLEHWEKMFDENEDFDPCSELDKSETVQITPAPQLISA